MSNEERVEYRRQVVAEYQSSGMTQKAFCREHGVALSTLGYWLKRERESQDAASTFVQIQPAADEGTARSGGTLRIRGRQHLELEVDLPVSREQMTDILQAVASL